MSMYGMDVENVRQTGNRLKEAAGTIRDNVSQLGSLVGSTTWQGPDAERFKGDEWSKVQAKLLEAADILDGAGQSALNNAQEQEDVSAR